MKIVADIKIPYLKGLLEPVAQEVAYLPGAEINSKVLRNAQVLLTRTRTCCDRALLDGTAVEFIGTATIGTDHIDLDYCRLHDIDVVNAPGCNAPAVAQWVHATVLRWAEARSVEGPLTLGVVGVGHVGSIVARWAQQLGYRVLLNDPPLEEQGVALEGRGLKEPHFSSLAALQRECDIITFHTPLTRNGKYPTWHLCDKEFLDGFFDDSRQLLDKAFVATPHIAGYSVQGKQRGTAMVVEALNRRYGWHVSPVQASTPLEGARQVTAQRILDSYDPVIDTARLKASPDTFEWQRNNYPLRQELS